MCGAKYLIIMASEKQEEDVERIVNCINSCWPDSSFTYMDIRKPCGEKFRDVLKKFLKGFLGGNYQLPTVNMNQFSRNPEMFQHLEGNMSLFREINNILKHLGYTKFKYGDMIKPTSNIVRDVLLNLVNFLAYFEAEETHKEEIEEEVQRIKHQVINNEKRLIEEERYLNKCRQTEEEKKLWGAELRHTLVKQKEKHLKIEAVVTKLEEEVDDFTKRMHGITVRIEQAANTLKQVEVEKERAAEAVVPDPDALQAELSKSHSDKEKVEADFMCLKNRLPILEQQIQDRTMQLQEHKETHQRLAQVKTRESKIKLEWQKTELGYRQVDEEKQILENQLKKDTSLIESKKRMFDEYNQKVEQLRGQLEKARSDVKQCMNEDECRKMQLQARIQAMESEVAQLNHDLNSGQKALEEGAAIFEAIHHKHQQQMAELSRKYEERFETIQHHLTNGNFPMSCS